MYAFCASFQHMCKSKRKHGPLMRLKVQYGWEVGLRLEMERGEGREASILKAHQEWVAVV